MSFSAISTSWPICYPINHTLKMIVKPLLYVEKFSFFCFIFAQINRVSSQMGFIFLCLLTMLNQTQESANFNMNYENKIDL